MSSLWRRQIVTAARPFLPHFPHAIPAFPAVSFGLASVGTVSLTPLGQKCLSADRTGPQLRGDAFRCQRRLKLRVKGQDSLTEITASISTAAEAVVTPIQLHAWGFIVMERAASHPVPTYMDSIILRSLSCCDGLLHSFKYIQIYPSLKIRKAPDIL